LKDDMIKSVPSGSLPSDYVIDYPNQVFRWDNYLYHFDGLRLWETKDDDCWHWKEVWSSRINPPPRMQRNYPPTKTTINPVNNKTLGNIYT